MALDYGYTIRIQQDGRLDPNTWFNNQWQRKLSGSTEWADVSGKTGNEYVVTKDDKAARVRLKQIFGSQKQELFSNELTVTSIDPPPPPPEADLLSMSTHCETICYAGAHTYLGKNGPSLVSLPYSGREAYVLSWGSQDDAEEAKSPGASRVGSFSQSPVAGWETKSTHSCYWDETKTVYGSSIGAYSFDDILNIETGVSAAQYNKLNRSAVFVDAKRKDRVIFMGATSTTWIDRNFTEGGETHRQSITWTGPTPETSNTAISNFVQTKDNEAVFIGRDDRIYFVNLETWEGYSMEAPFNTAGGMRLVYNPALNLIFGHHQTLNEMIRFDLTSKTGTDFPVLGPYDGRKWGGLAQGLDGKVWLLPNCKSSNPRCHYYDPVANSWLSKLITVNYLNANNTNVKYKVGLPGADGRIYCPPTAITKDNRNDFKMLRIKAFTPKSDWLWDPSDPLANYT